MRKRRIIFAALLGLCGALVGVALLLYDYARADVLGGPLPAPRMPPAERATLDRLRMDWAAATDNEREIFKAEIQPQPGV
jgi:hypothetical protein